MNKTLGALVLVALAGSLATPVLAVDQNINLTADVTSFCSINGLLTDNSETVVINTLNGFVSTTMIPRNYTIVCNGGSTTSLTSTNGGLSPIVPLSQPGFQNVINYTAETSGFATITGGNTATVGTVGTQEPLGSVIRATPNSASITVEITPSLNTLPLVVGSYADTLRLRIVAN
jgi:hypothetical protein